MGGSNEKLQTQFTKEELESTRETFNTISRIKDGYSYIYNYIYILYIRIV